MIFDYIFDSIPFVLAFSTPTMPVVAAPTAPTVEADAERKRLEVERAAQLAATASGRMSTDVGGMGMRMEKQRRRGAGLELGV